MTHDILAQRIAVAPHFSVHLQDAERVLLLSEERSFRLRGALYCALLSRLDGSLTGRQLCDQFRESASEQELTSILETLIERGYLVVLPHRFGPNLSAYWSAQGEPPSLAEERIAARRLGALALGRDEAAGPGGADALLALLAGSGFALAEPSEADLLFVLVDDYLQPSLADFAASRAAGRDWIPVKPGGLTAWLGPRFGPTAPASDHPAGLDEAGAPCFHCLARRLITHRPGDTLVESPPNGLRPARGWTAGSLALARGFATAEAQRLVRGEATRSERHLLTLDVRTAQIESHLAPRFQDCPVCQDARGRAGPRRGDAAAPAPLRLRKVATGGDGDGGWRALSAEQALARLEPLISPLTGIVSHIADIELAKGLYLSVASQANRERVDPRENRRLGKPGSAGGKGLSPVQARVSCLAEAVERYAAGWTGSEPRRAARYRELGEEAVHPAALLGFSRSQYERRDSLNPGCDPMHYIPEPFDEGRVVDWSPAWSLTKDAPRWLPTRFCYYEYRSPDAERDHRFCLGDSNGCASGGTLEEAILQGLLEVVERDAVSVWWYNRLQRPAIDLALVEPRLLAAMLGHAEAEGRSLEVLDLTTDLGVPVMAAVSADAESGGRISLGLGAHLDPVVAATRALTELNQILYFNGALERAADATDRTGPREEAPDAARLWYESATLAEHPYLAPSPAPRRRLDALGPGCLSAEGVDSIDAAVRRLVDRLAEHGHEVVVLDYDRADVPLACVKVAVPGLCHFWNRRGTPRLFAAPVAEGALAEPLAEDALNPVSFYI